MVSMFYGFLHTRRSTIRLSYGPLCGGSPVLAKARAAGTARGAQPGDPTNFRCKVRKRTSHEARNTIGSIES